MPSRNNGSYHIEPFSSQRVKMITGIILINPHSIFFILANAP